MDDRTATPATITLHAAKTSVAEAAVYFAFPSGRWTFDCVSCGAQCCRGHGYAMSLARDAATHWDGAKTLRLFAAPIDAANVMVSNFKPACYKLTTAGLCHVHAQHGFAAKPETCRLFPFNSLRIVGSYLVVEPHSNLCPLALSSSFSPLSDHGALLAAMRLDGIHLQIQRADGPGDQLDAVMRLEQAIRDLDPELGVGIEGFVASQMVLTAEAIDLPGPASMTEGLAEVRAFRPHLEKLLGCWPGLSHENAPELARIVRAVTPTLRSQLLFPSGTSVRLLLPLRVTRIPRLIFAIHKLVALAAEAGMATITYQTVMEIAHRYAFLLRFSVWADEPMKWRASRGQIYRRKGENRDAYGRYVRAARMLGSRDESMVLADVLSTSCGDDALGRLDRLDRLCRRLATSIKPRNDRLGSWRPSFGGWLLRNASESALWKFASARRGAARN